MFKFTFNSVIYPEKKSSFRAHNKYGIRLIGGVTKLFDNKKEADAFQAEVARFLSRRYSHLCFLMSDISQLYFRNYTRLMEAYRGNYTDNDAISTFWDINKSINIFSVSVQQRQRTKGGPLAAASGIIKISESLQRLCGIMLRQIPAGLDKQHIEHIQDELRILITSVRIYGLSKYTDDIELAISLKTMPPDWVIKEILNA